MPLALVQAVQTAANAVKDSPHLAEGIGLGIAYGIGKIFDRRLGKKRDTRGDINAATLQRIERNVGNLTKDLDDLSGDVRDLRTLMVGIDGENGLRGDVRELKDDVKEITKRELERAEKNVDRLHAPYQK